MQETGEPVIVAEQSANNEALEKLQKQVNDKENYIQQQAQQLEEFKNTQNSLSKPEQYVINDSMVSVGKDLIETAKVKADELGLNQEQFDRYLNSEVSRHNDAENKVKTNLQDKQMEFGKENLDAIEQFAKEKRGLSDASLAGLSIAELKNFNAQRNNAVYSNTNQAITPIAPEQVDTMALLNKIEDPTSTLQERIKAQEEYANAFRTKR